MYKKRGNVLAGMPNTCHCALHHVYFVVIIDACSSFVCRKPRIRLFFVAPLCFRIGLLHLLLRIVIMHCAGTWIWNFTVKLLVCRIVIHGSNFTVHAAIPIFLVCGTLILGMKVNWIGTFFNSFIVYCQENKLILKHCRLLKRTLYLEHALVSLSIPVENQLTDFR